MRRLLSLVLLAAFGLPIAAPLLALAQDSDAGLPLCCRRHGQHHCTMQDAQRHANTGPSLSSRCPFYPRNAVAPVTGAHLIVLHAPELTAPFASALAPAARAETHRRLAIERSHHKRGPPPALLA